MKLFNAVAMFCSQAGGAGVSSQDETRLQQELMAQRLRNEQRIEAIKQEMGEKYILHPSHNKSRLDTPRPV